VGVRRAEVVAELVRRDHDVPVLPVVVDERRREVAREIRGDAEGRPVAQ
jgi:hypothetical protein